MKTLKELKDELATKVARCTDLSDGAKVEKRDLNDAENSEVDTLLDEIEVLKRSIAREEKLAAAAEYRALGAAPQPALNETRELGKFNLVRGLQLLAQNKPLDGIEAEVHQEAVKEARSSGIEITGFGVPTFMTEKRSQTATGGSNGSQGGVTIPTDLNGLIEALWARTFLGQVGATRLSGLSGNIEMPVQDTKPAVSELTEIQEMGSTAITYSSLTMTPKRRGASIPFSKQLMLQSSLDVQGEIVKNISMALEEKMNTEAITTLLAAITSGNANLLALGTHGAAPTYENVVRLEELVSTAYADQGALRYLTNEKVRSKLKRTQKFSSTNGDPVFEAGSSINGYPAVISQVVPANLTKGDASGTCSAIVYGNFADLVLGMWGGMDFTVDPYTLAKKAQIEVTVNTFWDILVKRPKSFSGIKDALTV
jgi:HK97 family phage major capsid protein